MNTTRPAGASVINDRPRSVLWIAGLVFVAGAALRLISLAGEPFFVDVAASVKAIDSGEMVIQFPGYPLYHLLLAMLARATGSVFGAQVLFSLACGLGAFSFFAYRAYTDPNRAATIPALTVMGFSVLTVYFSGVGSSYTTDLLAAAAMLFYAERFSRRRTAHSYFGVLCWFIFGCLMRPLSFAFTAPAIVYLLAKDFSCRRMLISLLAVAAAAALYVALAVHFYGSMAAVLNEFAKIRSELDHFNMTRFLTNSFRIVAYPVWGLHLFLPFAFFAIWSGRKRINKDFAVFLLCFSVPYFLLLLRYIPHAGYYCLLIPPALMALNLPACAMTSVRKSLYISVAFAALASLQFMTAKPLTVTGPATLVANVYFLQYSRAGIKSATFDTLAGLARKTGILSELIPQGR